MDLLRVRERAASRGRETDRAKKDLDRALDGFHPPAKPRGPEPKLANVDLVREHFTAVEFLRDVCKRYRRNDDLLSGEIASKFGVPKARVTQGVIPLLRASRRLNPKGRYADAAFRTLSLKHGLASGTTKRLLTKQRKAGHLTIGFFRLICRELLWFHEDLARSDGPAIGLRDEDAELFSRALASKAERFRIHIDGLSSPRRMEHLLRHEAELRRLSTLHSLLISLVPAWFEHRESQ